MSKSISIENLQSTIPCNTVITMMGFAEDDDFINQFGETFKEVILACGRYMDLSLLDGVTIGFDYDAALQAVDLGYESSIAKGYTNTENLIGVAKTLRVKREGVIKAHVVFNAGMLTRLTDHDHPDWLATVNLIAHEMGHVNVIAWFEKHSPGIILEPFKGDWLRGILLENAYTCWEEYAACRLASVFNHSLVEEDLLSMATGQVNEAFTTAHKIITDYRTNAELNRSVQGVLFAVTNPIKFISYYLGHLSGTQDSESIKIDNTLFGVYAPFINTLQEELHNSWEIRETWDGLNGMNGLVNLMLEIYSSAGMVINLDYSEKGGGSYVHFPFTAHTLPGGEDTYRLMKLRGQI